MAESYNTSFQQSVSVPCQHFVYDNSTYHTSITAEVSNLIYIYSVILYYIYGSRSFWSRSFGSGTLRSRYIMTATVMSPTLMTATKMTGHVYIYTLHQHHRRGEQPYILLYSVILYYLYIHYTSITAEVRTFVSSGKQKQDFSSANSIGL